jgi:hypothetical protein
MLKFDLQLKPSELGEAAIVNSLIHQRDSLLDRLADAPPQLEDLLLLRAEAAFLRRAFKDYRILVEGLRAEKEKRAAQTQAAIRR